MARDIIVLHWTTSKGFKKGELVLQQGGLFIYKTAKKLLRGADNFREIVYAELPFDAIEEISVLKSGMLKKHSLKIQVKKATFDKILNEKHSLLFKHILKLFNRQNVLYFPVLSNKVEDINTFVKMVKERLK